MTPSKPFEFPQLELHVYNPQHKLVEYLKSKGIVAQAYSPLGSTNGPLLTDEDVVAIAKKHSLNPSDVLIGYLRTFYRNQYLTQINIRLIMTHYSDEGVRCLAEIDHTLSHCVQPDGCRHCHSKVG